MAVQNFAETLVGFPVVLVLLVMLLSFPCSTTTPQHPSNALSGSPNRNSHPNTTGGHIRITNKADFENYPRPATNSKTHDSHALNHTTRASLAYKNIIPQEGELANDTVQESRDRESKQFNVTAAVILGARAHYDYCGHFCNHTTKTDSTDTCSAHIFCQTCYCDDVCPQYGDCCPEAGVGDELQNIHPPRYACVKMSDAKGRVYNVKVIASCPENFDSESSSQALCEESATNFTSPVLSRTTSIVYCSMSCSLCNGESNSVPLEKVKICDSDGDENNDTFLVSNASIERNAVIHHQIRIRDSDSNTAVCFVLPAGSTPRVCDGYEKLAKQHVTVCNASSFVANAAEDYELIVGLCNNYTYPVYTSETSFKNFFCALCNDVVPHDCADSTITGKFRLSVLTSLKNQPTTKQIQYLGNNDTWHDKYKDKSRKVFCQSDRVWAGGQDVALFCDLVRKNSTLMDWYQLLVRFKPLTNITHLQLDKDWQQVRGHLAQHLADVTKRLDPVTYAFGIDKQFVNTTEPSIVTSVQFLISTVENRTHFERSVLSLYTNPRILIQALQITPLLEMCIYDFSMDIFNISNLSSSFDNGSCCRFEVREEWEERVSSMYPVDAVSIIPFDQTSPFTNVILNPNEYTIDGSVVVLTYANVTLEVCEVKKNGTFLIVPLEHLIKAYKNAGFLQNATPSLAFSEEYIETMLSYIFLTISIISLIFVLATYSTFPQLRSLPGINNMFLASWLLIGQVLLLTVPFRTEIPDLCRVLGALLHYAWLAVVFWMSACSFHMFHVFVVLQSSLQKQHSHAWYIKRYVTLTHLLPLVIVAIVIIVSWTSSHGQDIGYGGHVCYLNSPLLVGLGFVLPLASCVTINMVLLALTTQALMSMSRVQSSLPVVCEIERPNVPVYIKLSSLTGVCWVVALLAEVPGCWWLKYVSVVLNGLQGLHLALSYTANKRVIKMWRELFHKNLGIFLEMSDRSSLTQRSTKTSSLN